jgi:hypothetical protein
MPLLKSTAVISLLFSFFLISTCTKDSSITGNSDQALGKTTGVEDNNDIAGGDKEGGDKEWERLAQKAFVKFLAGSFTWNDIMDYSFESCLNYILDDENGDDDHHEHQDKSYNFRDNYLKYSDKGVEYIACYYILGKYGIENNLLNKYYKEHSELLKNSIDIAYDLQYGSNTNQILINKKTSDDLKEMLKVYRNSTNHREIEPVLNYLEADLEKYYDKPKFEIAADFVQN